MTCPILTRAIYSILVSPPRMRPKKRWQAQIFHLTIWIFSANSLGSERVVNGRFTTIQKKAESPIERFGLFELVTPLQEVKFSAFQISYPAGVGYSGYV